MFWGFQILHVWFVILRKGTSFVLFCSVLNKGISGFVGKLERTLHPAKKRKKTFSGGIFKEIEATKIWDNSSGVSQPSVLKFLNLSLSLSYTHTHTHSKSYVLFM